MKSKIKKVMEKNKNEIILSLPGFINQLLLLMNSGAVLTEAFCKIAEGYGVLDERKAGKMSFKAFTSSGELQM